MVINLQSSLLWRGFFIFNQIDREPNRKKKSVTQQKRIYKSTYSFPQLQGGETKICRKCIKIECFEQKHKIFHEKGEQITSRQGISSMSWQWTARFAPQFILFGSLILITAFIIIQGAPFTQDKVWLLFHGINYNRSYIKAKVYNPIQ